MMNEKSHTRLTDEQILQAVRDVEVAGFGLTIIKVRHGVACFIEQQLTKHVKPKAEPEQTNQEYLI